MSLQVLLDKFKTDLESHVSLVEADIAAKIADAEKAIHDRWDAMGAAFKDLEDKLLNHPAAAKPAVAPAPAETPKAEVSSDGAQ